MTDKQLFMDKLRTALAERGISDDDAAFYLNDRFYDILAKDSAENTALDKVDLMADGIAARIKERAKVTESEEITAVAEDIPVQETGAPAFDENEAPTTEAFIPPELLCDSVPAEEQTITINSVIDEIFDGTANEPTAEIDVIPHEAVEPSRPDERTQTVDAVLDTDAAEAPLSEYDDEYSDHSYSEYVAEQQNEIPAYTEEPLEEFDFDEDFNDLMVDDAPSSRLPDYVEEEPIPNSKLFWVLFAVSSPIWLSLLAVLLSLFVGAWVSLAALIVGAIAVMVAVIGAGSAAALVGIIYGIIQVTSTETLPMGIYNIGLGIISVGVTMFVGILVYNLAIRFLPWLIKLVGGLFRHTLKQLKRLFNFLRRECAKQ